MVVMVNEVVVQIKYISKTTCHPGTKVMSDFTQYGHDTTGHVFTAVIARAFNHGKGTRVTHRKALARSSRCKQFTASGTVQTGVPNNRGILGLEWRTFWREDRQTTTSHPFTHVIVGIAFQLDV